MTELPAEWAVATLGTLAENRDNRRVPVNATERAARPGAVPYYGASGQVGWIDRPLFDEPLLLIGEDGVQFFDLNKPKAYLISGPSWVNNHAHVLAAIDGVDLRYLMHYLNQVDYHGHANGTTRLKLTRTAMDRIPVAVAPSDEQVRIVAAIQEAFSLLDAAETALHNTRTRLRRMRDSVLTAAVTGQLVPQDPTDASDTHLLADAGGPIDIDPSDLPTIPSSWTWVRLSELALSAGYGTSVKCSYEEDGVGVLRIPNIQSGAIDLNNLKRAPADSNLGDRLMLAAGDLLIVRTNGSRDLIGRCAPIVRDLDCSFASYLIRYRLRQELASPTFVSVVLSARWWRGVLESKAASSAGQYNLSLASLGPLPVALPPLAEQLRIVAEVERQYSFIEACERAVDAALTRSAGLRRSVLKAAFEGRLVPQDGSDEPASVLLERIAAERGSAPRKASRRRRVKVEAS